MKWTNERIELLKKLWADGLSASQIAGGLGITRSGVLGKVYRLGLWRPRTIKKPRSKPATKSRTRRTVAVDTYHKVTYAILAQPVERAVYGAGKVTFMQLERHHCRWPMDTNFCGANAVDGRPYCEYHCGVAGRKYEI